MATTRDTVLARILIDDQTKVGFQSYARNAERAKKTTEAFRAHAVDKLVSSLDQQFLALKKTSRELDIAKAATLGATAAEQGYINKLHGDIDAHHQAVALEAQLSKEREQAAAATDRVAAAVHRSEQAYLQERATVGMTADELEIYRLKMMGATQAQLESVMSTQEATKAFRKQGTAAAGTAKGGLRLMRGGMGQLGHQVQDVAVQLQMGQNALLIFGQQGSQVASLFGQNGALIGAVLAVGAALGTYLMPKIFNSKDAMKELKKIAEETSKILEVDFLSSTANLTDAFVKLSEESKILAESRIRLALVSSVIAAAKAMDSFRDSASALRFSDMEQGINHTADSLGVMVDRLKINREEAGKLREMYAALSSGGDDAAIALAEYTHELVLSKDASNEENEALIKINNTLQETVDAVRRAATTQKLFQGAIEGTVQAELKEDKVASDALSKEAERIKSFEDLIQGYGEQLLVLQQGEEALLRYNLAQDGFTDSQINAAMRLRKTVKDQEKANSVSEESAETVRTEAAAIDGFVTSLIESTEEIGLNTDALLTLQAARLGVDPAVIATLIEERNVRLGLVAATEAEAQAEIDTQAAIDSVHESRKDLVAGIVAEADALRQSSTDLAIQQAALLGLGVVAQQQFDDAIKRIRDYEEEQENIGKKKQAGSAVEALRQSLLSKEEALVESYARELEIINNAESLKLDNEINYTDLRLALLEDFQKKKADILKKGKDQEILTGSDLTGHMLGQLGKQFSGVKAVNKKMFAAQKAYKLASAIQNTFTAANEALASPYPWPMPQVFAATAVAAGMANVAAIKSSSFEGGGFTGNGARSGGTDGKGGFLATLHPNESVIDHTKGQAGGITIINNVDASGSGGDVDMKIRSAMQQTSQQTVLAIQDLMKRRRFG